MPARRPPEDRHEVGLPELGHLADGGDPQAAQLVGGHGPDAPEPFHRQRVQKRQLAVGRHHEQAVGLGHAAGHLGEELGPGHADRDRQTNPLEDLAPQARRSPWACPRSARARARRGTPRRSTALRPAAWSGRRPRTPPCWPRSTPTSAAGRRPPAGTAGGLRSTHRGADAARLGLVAGREHDARPDDDGAAAQARVIPLLDRRIERVEVGVQDRGLDNDTNTCSHPQGASGHSVEVEPGLHVRTSEQDGSAMLRKQTLPAGVVEATRRQGRTVLLSEKAMGHIARRHPELDGCELAITIAVETATFRCRGNAPDREVLYAPSLGPGSWLAVVVAYEGVRAGSLQPTPTSADPATRTSYETHRPRQARRLDVRLWEYDQEGDVLYLSMGKPRPGRGEQTPEGHILRFDAEGEFCGVTLVGAWHLGEGRLRGRNVAAQAKSPPLPRVRRGRRPSQSLRLGRGDQVVDTLPREARTLGYLGDRHPGVLSALQRARQLSSGLPLPIVCALALV